LRVVVSGPLFTGKPLLPALLSKKYRVGVVGAHQPMVGALSAVGLSLLQPIKKETKRAQRSRRKRRNEEEAEAEGAEDPANTNAVAKGCESGSRGVVDETSGRADSVAVSHSRLQISGLSLRQTESQREMPLRPLSVSVSV
jgi:hypothetical protein